MKIKMKKQDQLTLEEGFEKFLQKCIIRNLAPQTLEYYQSGYVRLTDYFDKETLLSEIHSELLDEYVMNLRKQTNANDITIASYMRAVRAIFYYFMKMGYMNQFQITIPRAVKKVKETYTDAELEILLKKPNVNRCTFTEYKTWAYVNYLLATGNRVSTALNLQVSDLDFENLLIRLRTTKNKKEQFIPMALSLRPILLEFLEVRGNESDNYIFCTNVGEKSTLRTMS